MSITSHVSEESLSKLLGENERLRQENRDLTQENAALKGTLSNQSRNLKDLEDALGGLRKRLKTVVADIES